MIIQTDDRKKRRKLLISVAFSLSIAKILQTSEIYKVYFKYLTASAVYLRDLSQRYYKRAKYIKFTLKYLTASAVYLRGLSQRYNKRAKVSAKRKKNVFCYRFNNN